MISLPVIYATRIYQLLRGEVLIIPARTLILIVCLVLLILPAVISQPLTLRVLIMASIFAILAASWDLLSGFTGQVSFGHALFFGVSAYTAVLLNQNIGLAPWATVPIGAIAAVVAGLAIGVPCLRLRGTYLSFATLAFPLILAGVVMAIPSVTGGEYGISGMDRLSDSRMVTYYMVIPSMMILGLIMWKISDSKTGLIFHAIREDEVTARASGINTTRYKLLAFSLSGLFAGIAGGLFAHVMPTVGPSVLGLTRSFEVIIWAVFGGIATIYGPMFGALLLFSLSELVFTQYLHVPKEAKLLILACLVMLVLLFMPRGLTTWMRDKTEKICPRCKLQNVATRKTCRVCTADLD
ncbi:MAG: branched-chain amino acid ABC transporter permease [Dehalococcoidia bacterium]|nr:MAG: branched-chain amino acid ABC transporter permease [Dehalococcoidia bacterium]